MPKQSIQKITDPETCIQKLGELISGIKVAMLTTLNPAGGFHSRPMWTQKLKFDGQLWFFAGAHSPKALELRKDAHIALAYSDPEDSRYVAVTGIAHSVQDRARAEKLWSPLYQAWFPKGLDDPELSLICVDVAVAEYWDSPSSQVVQLVGFKNGKGERRQLKEPGKLHLAG